MKEFAIGIFAVILLCTIGFWVRWCNLQQEEYFAPKEQDVKRKVFKRTKSFNEAKAQDLTKYRLEYLREKDPAAKEAIASTIRLSFADYDPADIENADLADFLRRIMLGETINQ